MKLTKTQIEALEKAFKNNNFSLREVLDANETVYQKIVETGSVPYFLCLFNLKPQIRNYEILKNPDFKAEDIIIQRKTEKIRFLGEWLEKEKHINPSRAFSISENKWQKILKGSLVPSHNLLRIVSQYFFLDLKMLEDDSVELLDSSKLRVDEDLLSIQRKDIENTLLKNKNKHYIARNYRVLGHGKRVQLFASCIGIAAPLVAFSMVCAGVVLKDRFECEAKYYNNNIDQTVQVAAEEEYKNESAKYSYAPVQVAVGSQIIRIQNIDPSTSSFQARMRLWMDFDLVDYYQMYMRVYHPTIATNKYMFSKSVITKDEVGLNENGEFIKESDYIPDCVQVDDYESILNNNGGSLIDGSGSVVSGVKTNDYYYGVKNSVKNYFPLQTSPNTFPDNETMFYMKNGDIDENSFGYDEYFCYLSDSGTYRYFQKATFSVTVTDTFSSPRYPLESYQFHIYTTPITTLSQMQMQYTTIGPDGSDNIKVNVVEKTLSGYNQYSVIYKTGTEEQIGTFAGGFKLINSNGIKGLISRINYYKDNVEQNYRTEYELVLRANRSGMNTFLKAYINLFAVVIWIVIAFYSQAYQGENAIGMLGTGLFAAISAIIVGLNMVSDAGMFSLITMINIFTLAVILIMTYQTIMARQAQVSQDKVAISYAGIKLRILFIILTVCTVIMFVGLPISAYIWAF